MTDDDLPIQFAGQEPSEQEVTDAEAYLMSGVVLALVATSFLMIVFKVSA